MRQAQRQRTLPSAAQAGHRTSRRDEQRARRSQQQLLQRGLRQGGRQAGGGARGGGGGTWRGAGAGGASRSGFFMALFALVQCTSTSTFTYSACSHHTHAITNIIASVGCKFVLVTLYIMWGQA